MVVVARYVELDLIDAHEGYLDAEAAREALCDLGPHGIIDLIDAALDLGERDVEVRGGVGDRRLRVALDGVANLNLEVVEVELVELVELDEPAIVPDAIIDDSACRDGHGEVEARAVDVEERLAEADLNSLDEVDEVDLRLEGRTVVGGAADLSEDREVGRLKDLLAGSLDEVW